MFFIIINFLVSIWLFIICNCSHYFIKPFFCLVMICNFMIISCIFISVCCSSICILMLILVFILLCFISLLLFSLPFLICCYFHLAVYVLFVVGRMSPGCYCNSLNRNVVLFRIIMITCLTLMDCSNWTEPMILLLLIT